MKSNYRIEGPVSIPSEEVKLYYSDKMINHFGKLKEGFDHGYPCLLLLEVNSNSLIGYCHYCHSIEYGMYHLGISYVYIHPEYRGVGLSSLFVDTLEGIVREEIETKRSIIASGSTLNGTTGLGELFMDKLGPRIDEIFKAQGIEYTPHNDGLN